ncbi:MAG TPA: hypothetical protein VJJ72_00605 [Candidatus Paceibacterota bacterium]
MSPERFTYPDKPGQPFIIPREEMPQIRKLTPSEKEQLGLTEKKKGRRRRAEEESGRISFAEAEAILGRDFLGPEMASKVWGFQGEAPPIPFTREDLERAKELGQFLVLRIDRTPDGEPLTMLKIHEYLMPKYQAKNQGKVLYDTTEQWKLDSDFFTVETPRIQWALVSKEVLPGSTSANYLIQTEHLADYLRGQVFRGRSLPQEYEEAVTEFENAKPDIIALMTSDWQKAAEKLENLKITKMLRPVPVDVLYDTASYLQYNNVRRLEDKYAWTSRRSSGGGLVCVGRAGAGGAGVDGWEPDGSDSGLGVVFSRSLFLP